MKAIFCTQLLLISISLAAAGEETAATTDTPLAGGKTQLFHDVGPRRSVLVGVEVCYGKFGTDDVVHGIRPIYLDAQGRELLGSLHGMDTGRPPVRVKAKKGFAVGAISIKAGLGIDGFSVTFMKVDKGHLDPQQSYESVWLGGPGGFAVKRLGSTGEPVVGLFGSENNQSQLNGLGLVLSNKSIEPPAGKKLPLPDEAAQANALKLAKEVYGEEWKAAKSPSQKRELATKILHSADESDNDPAGRYILLKLARETATQAADGLIAFEAIDAMAEQFQIDDVEMKTNVLAILSKRAKLPDEHKSIADQAAGLIDGAIARDNIDLAVKLCEMALPEARAAHDADLVREVKARIEQCRVLGKAHHEMQEAAAVLGAKPDDPAANLIVGKYYCFHKGDWEKGLPMLALGQDRELKALAVQEIAEVKTADDRLKLGDAWWNLGEKESGKIQVAIRGRANYWYQQALPELSGLSRAKVEKRVKEFETASEGSDEPATAKRPSKYLPGLVGQYYGDIAFQRAVNARVDSTLDFEWNFGPPDPAMRNALQRPLARLYQGAQVGPLRHSGPRPSGLPGDDR